MPEDRYPKQLLVGNVSYIEVDKGEQQGVERLMNSVSFGLDKHEWVEDIKRGEFISFILACIEESISERKDRQ